MSSTDKKYRYTIGIDPSGSYKEGHGTTGWCVLDNQTNKVLEVGTISAKLYPNCFEYWNAHIKLIDELINKYSDNTNCTAVSIENYVLYKSHAMAQVNSELETVQLLGIIKQHCYLFQINYYLRPAVAVKARWSDEVLLHYNIICKHNKHFIISNIPSKVLCDHERDAIRHAVHFNMFENK